MINQPCVTAVGPWAWAYLAAIRATHRHAEVVKSSDVNCRQRFWCRFTCKTRIGLRFCITFCSCIRVTDFLLTALLQRERDAYAQLHSVDSRRLRVGLVACCLGPYLARSKTKLSATSSQLISVILWEFLPVVVLMSLYLDATLRVGGIEEKEEEENWCMPRGSLHRDRVVSEIFTDPRMRNFWVVVYNYSCCKSVSLNSTAPGPME